MKDLTELQIAIERRSDSTGEEQWWNARVFHNDEKLTQISAKSKQALARNIELAILAYLEADS